TATIVAGRNRARGVGLARCAKSSIMTGLLRPGVRLPAHHTSKPDIGLREDYVRRPPFDFRDFLPIRGGAGGTHFGVSLMMPVSPCAGCAQPLPAIGQLGPTA